MENKVEACELCNSAGGEVVWESSLCRVVMLADADYPGYCRVILQRHLSEMTDLPPSERIQVMNIVFAVETAIRHLCQPDKVNLASLGNFVPHLHWHVIPRWRDDKHFPNPIWGSAQRVVSQRRQAVDGQALGEHIITALRTVQRGVAP